MTLIAVASFWPYSPPAQTPKSIPAFLCGYDTFGTIERDPFIFTQVIICTSRKCLCLTQFRSLIPYQFKSQHPQSNPAIFLWYDTLYYNFKEIHSLIIKLLSWKFLFQAPFCPIIYKQFSSNNPQNQSKTSIGGMASYGTISKRFMDKAIVQKLWEIFFPA